MVMLVDVLWLFSAERSEHTLLMWVLVDLLQVCLLIAGQILEVSYIVLSLDISTATGFTECHLVQALSFAASEENFLALTWPLIL